MRHPLISPIFWQRLSLVLTLAATACHRGTQGSLAAADAGATPGEAADGRRARLAELRRGNRAYQVCVGRAFDPSREAEAATATPPLELCRKLTQTSEGEQVLAERLSRFFTERGKAATTVKGANLQPGAQVSRTPLELVPDAARSVEGGDDGRLCSEHAKNSACFVLWLATDVAPGLAGKWTDAEIEALTTKPYAQVLEMIVEKSLTL
jgi:hypothetical protein